jgi:hypothetical protein
MMFDTPYMSADQRSAFLKSVDTASVNMDVSLAAWEIVYKILSAPPSMDTMKSKWVPAGVNTYTRAMFSGERNSTKLFDETNTSYYAAILSDENHNQLYVPVATMRYFCVAQNGVFKRDSFTPTVFPPNSYVYTHTSLAGVIDPGEPTYVLTSQQYFHYEEMIRDAESKGAFGEFSCTLPNQTHPDWTVHIDHHLLPERTADHWKVFVFIKPDNLQGIEHKLRHGSFKGNYQYMREAEEVVEFIALNNGATKKNPYKDFNKYIGLEFTAWVVKPTDALGWAWLHVIAVQNGFIVDDTNYPFSAESFGQ